MEHTVTRETWREIVRSRHLNAAVLALATGKSQRAVRSYLEATRRPSDEWIERVGLVVAALDVPMAIAREESAA